MLDQQLLQSYTLHAIGFVCVCVLKNCEQALEQKLIITMLKQLLLYMNILIFWSIFLSSIASMHFSWISHYCHIRIACNWLCVCVCTCVCMCVCACMHVCVHVYVCACVCACMHACMHAWICVWVLLNWKMHGLSTTSYRYYLFWAELLGTTWMNNLPTEYEEILVVK